MLKIGRNDKCICGSGRKYKHCHLGKEQDLFIPPYHHKMSGTVFGRGGSGLSLHERNMALVMGLIDIFSLDGKKDWPEIKRSISRDHVKELYKLIAWLWPPDTDVWSLLPKPENKLRSLYLGWMRPETVLQSVVRYSLYCDEILVMNPFLNPWYIAEKYNPLVHPEDYIADTIKWLFFVLQLAPWIESGHVILLPEVGNFDSGLRKETWKLAEKRMSTVTKADEEIIMNDPHMNKYSEEDFKRMWLATPTDAMRSKMKKFYPKMSDADVEKHLEYIEKIKDRDPYYPTNPNERGTFGLHTSMSGGNLEMGLFLSQLTGSYMYTDFAWRWKEILSTANEGTGSNLSNWAPITHAFQQLDFKFLDNVTPAFANRIREEGRLENMRNFLRKTWSIAASQPNENKVNDVALHFKDELNEEYNKAEMEWKKIDVNLAKWVMSEGGVGGIITAGMNWKLPALGFAVAAVGHLLESRFERKQFKTNVPLSVFVDLNRGVQK